MAELGIFRGAARADVKVTASPTSIDSAFCTTTVGSPQPTGDQATWEGNPGTSVTLRVKWTRATGSTSGLAQAPNFITVEARLPGAAASFGANTWTLGAAGDDAFPAVDTEVSRTFHFDTDPLNFTAGTAASGMLEIYLNWGSTGGAAPWNADSRGGGSTNALDTRDNARGYLRSPVIISNDPAPSNVSIGGAEPSLFASPDPIHTRITCSAVKYRSVGLELELLRTGTSTMEREQTLTQTAVNHDYSWTDTTGSNRRVGNGMALVSEAKDLRLKMAALDFGGDNEYVFGAHALTTLDASGNGRSGTLVGTTVPALVSSPFSGFGNALDFNGVDLDDNSAGVNCGATGLGVSLAFRIKAKIRRGRIGTQEVIAGKWNASSASASNFKLYITSTNKLELVVTKSGAELALATGTTTLAVNTNYDVEGEWTGTVIKVKVNGTEEGTTASVTALQAPDATTPFTIGRDSSITSGPFPFDGIIDEVELIENSITKGLWHFDVLESWARDSDLQLTAPNQLTVDPRLNMQNSATDTQAALYQLQATGSEFLDPPSSGNNTDGQRQFPDVGFVSVRYNNARNEGQNSLSVTLKMWDSDEIQGSESSPVHTFSGTTATRRDPPPTVVTPQAGWLPAAASGADENKLPITWSTVISGNWKIKSEVTAPADMTGLEIYPESEGSDVWNRTVAFISINPNIQVAFYLNNLTNPGRHIKAGDELKIIASATHELTGLRLVPDAAYFWMTHTGPAGTLQQLTSLTDNTSAAWTDWPAATARTKHNFDIDATNKIATKTLSATAGWGVTPKVMRVVLTISGTPYPAFVAREMPDVKFLHDATTEASIPYDSVSGHHHVGTDSRAIGER